MNDMKFTTAGDYMADYDGMLGTTDNIREPEKFQSVTTTVRDKEQIYNIKVEREVAEITNLILLRENALMRYELNMKFPWETEQVNPW